jgi:hypothetical protein
MSESASSGLVVVALVAAASGAALLAWVCLHIASVTIDTNLLFSDVLIETTGGANPIHCRGHHKAHAVEMKRLIEQYQSEYYRQR